ncbi:MAG: immunoglobulin domain-containing protein [Verrucomicrobia bacterium]|nr:immunoglobulin domain-containing protein [Verrucomicrobiota bacterium]
MVIIAAGWALVAPALAYVFITDSSGIYVVTWPPGSVPIQVKLSQSTLSDGNSQLSSVLAAMQSWNSVLGTVQLAGTAAGGSYSSGNGINEIAMDSTFQGESFDAGTLAVTLSSRDGNRRVESDIVFNNSYFWDSYRGNLRNGVQDIQRVAMHELGHLLGLDHPDEHGQSVTTIMNSYVTNVYALQIDDITGVQKLYGAPGVKPVNDDFASATNLVLSGTTVQVTGSNVAATREAGEPDHVGVAQGHSVWWKWTAPGSGSATFSTYGSIYDTVMSVYTGSAVNALTLIGENDDEEPSSQFSGPSRKRTSIVTFDAVSGTTYYIAVDGWGNVSDGSIPYTGAITLNLTYTPPPTPVVVQTQPADRTVTVGQSVVFQVSGTGYPPPQYRWQRLAAAGGGWTDLSDDASFSGAATATLTIASVPYTWNGDQFRCQLSNSSGTASSNPATLRVNAISPVFQSSPAYVGVDVGQPAQFAISVTGNPTPTLQWQHQSSNGGGWTNLPEGGDYLNTNGLTLSIPHTTIGMNGDQYRCVATNPGGTVTSAAATLTVFTASGIIQVATGSQHSLFIRADGALWAMGANNQGQLGTGSNDEKDAPVQVDTGVVAVAASSNVSVFIKTDGSLYGMGWGRLGQLGRGVIFRSFSPEIVASGPVVAAACGQNMTMFLRADGTLWIMGTDNMFQDPGVTVSDAVPRQVASGVRSFSISDEHCAYVLYDGSLWETGSRGSGRIGDGITTGGFTGGPERIDGSAASVSLGIQSKITTFVREDGTLWGSGLNQSGVLGSYQGPGNLGSIYVPVQIASGLAQLSCGGNSLLFTKADGTLWGLGANGVGQLGDGSGSNQSSPVQVASGVARIQAGPEHSLFTKADGSLWGMGNGANGRLGVGNAVYRSPVLIKAGVLPVPAGPAGLAATKGEAAAYVRLSWKPQADAAAYEIWRSTANDSAGAARIAANLTVPIYYDTGATGQTVYYYWVKAVNGAGGSVLTGGQSGYRSPVVPVVIQAQPAPASAAPRMRTTFSVAASGDPAPAFQWQRLAAGQSGWTDLANGTDYTGAISATLVVTAMQTGMNGDQFRCRVTNLGGTVTSDAATLTLAAQPGVVAASVYENRSFYVTADGGLWAAGSADSGQLGLGGNTAAAAPYVTGNVVAVDTSYYDSLLLKADGTVWGTGLNSQFELGTGNNTARTTFGQLATGAVAIATGASLSRILKADGTLWVAGINNAGQYGNGTNYQAYSFIKVASSVAAISAGYASSFYIKADGTLWGMGTTSTGEFGDGRSSVHLDPFTVATGVKMVSSEYSHTAFVKTDGTLWAMGYNDMGQVGDGSTAMRLSPVQVASNVVSVACGLKYTLFVKTDGSLWGMGDNSGGQLGAGAVPSTAVPIMILPSGVVSAQAGQVHSLFVKSDGSLWGMGSNASGQLLTASDTRVPVQLISGTLTLPGTATGLAVANETAAQCIRLSWLPVPGAVSYEIWRNTADDRATASQVAAGLPSAIGYDYPSATGRYYYWVRARNQAGAGGDTPSAVIDYTYVAAPVPPVFVSLPADQTTQAGSGSTVTFSVAVTGVPAPALRWQYSSDGAVTWSDMSDGSAYSGTTTATLSVVRPSALLSGYQFRVLASNPAARDLPSAPATLTVIPIDYTGSYFGTLPSGGYWGLWVRPDSTAVLLSYVGDRASVAVMKSITIGRDGSFTASGSELRSAGSSPPFFVSGQINFDGTVTGIFSGRAYSGARDAGGSAPAGLYTASAIGTAQTSIYAIVGSSGRAVLVKIATAAFDGAQGTMDGSGQLTASTSIGNATISLAVGPSARTVQATLTEAGSSMPVVYNGLSDIVPSTARVLNLSVRTPAGTGSQTLIIGFVINGSGTKGLLLRGIGPALGPKGVSNPLADPSMRLLNATGVELSTNNDWGGGNVLSQQFAAVGAFPLPTDSKDAALYRTLSPGVYSYHTFPADTGTGVVLGEAYDTDDDTSTAAVVNMSARTQVGTGENILIAGFVIAGNAPTTLLIRGLGPTLTSKGVNGALADPQLYLFGSSGVIASNDNWGGTDALKVAFATVGAGGLAADYSKDAALLITLNPGVYSAQVSGVGNTTGVGLVEIYLVP